MANPRKDDAVLGGKGNQDSAKAQPGDLVLGGTAEGNAALERKKDIRVIQEAFGCDERTARRCVDIRNDPIDSFHGGGLFLTQAEIDARKRLYGE